MITSWRINRLDSTKNIENQYFEWLCALIGEFLQGQKEFAWHLHHLPYMGYIPNDSNREEDGRDLRKRFAEEEILFRERHFIDFEGPCSVLEMLIALAIKMDYVLSDLSTGIRYSKWFGEFVKNLDLRVYDDDTPGIARLQDINERLIRAWIRREYSPSGKGGLFPLEHGEKDQRRVEIWYQMMAYLDENYAD